MSAMRLPSAALLARYPETLPYLVHYAPVEPYVAGGLPLAPLYAAAVGTRTNLYFIQADAPKGAITIGVGLRPDARRDQLQVGCPYPLTLVTHVPGTAGIEHAIHSHLAAYHREGEWFDPAVPVLEVVAEFFEISLMMEDYAGDGCELAFDDLAMIMADYEEGV